MAWLFDGTAGIALALAVLRITTVLVTGRELACGGLPADAPVSP
ncbi:MAG: hypothetical protein V5A56_14450 [Halolamina sp.]